MRMHDTIKPVIAIVPGTVTSDNAAVVSAILDAAGFADVELIIMTGTLADADATFAVLLEHGDAANLSDAVAVDDDELIGTEAAAAFTYADDNKTRKLGYRGMKRFLRATITPSANASAANLAGLWLLSGARKQPV
ncbi:hypothetical protein MCW82_07090 [Azospirillum doebereinerae]|uniref:hypothetical protein n=1 Tax=Azospirillum doebereinerae TaxID=92933 RepID=UPI001EE5D51E|nr:hypothetical protein [Azospirillum doebereinerae]MCG5239532.1 hypothetical protein [Azospirillum doebereinerae]